MIKNGTHVKVTLGERDVDATVIEDRGNARAGGWHLLRIRVGEGEAAMEFEVFVPPEPAIPESKPSATAGRIPVLVEVTIKLVMDFPANYTDNTRGSGEDSLKDMVEFYLNESSTCASNELRRLSKRLEEQGDGCACNQTESKFVRVATEADCEMYHYESEKEPT